MLINKYLILLGGCLSLASTALATPSNLHWKEKTIVGYADSRSYMTEVARVDSAAETVLKQAIAHHKDPKKIAVVLDVDETSLSNLKQIKTLIYLMSQLGDTLPKKDLAILNKPFQDPAIAPTLKLYRYAISKGMNVFFLTGRYEQDRKASACNLKVAGYTKWKQLILRQPSQMKESTIEYKTSQRKKITAEGYHIIINMGDQYSDLTGGYAAHSYKLPDPFYYLP